MTENGLVDAEESEAGVLMVANDEGNVEGAGDGGDVALPNNDFCFTTEDFIETRSQMNEATRHHGTYLNAWQDIQRLLGEEVEVGNTSSGMIVWKIVKSVNDDEFSNVSYSQDEAGYSIHDPSGTFSEQDYAKAFWHLWPTNIDDDVLKLNNIIDSGNVQRKKNFQRVLKKVSSSEYIIFHALTIAASAHSERGDQLWEQECFGRKKRIRRQGLSGSVDFGQYMKIWRFWQLQQLVPKLMEDSEVKDVDDWWRLRGGITRFNRIRKKKLIGSHIAVFDESMSAFIPRLVTNNH